MSKRIITAKNGPKPIGKYSNAVKSCGLVYTSGQLPIDPSSGEIIKGDIVKATWQVMENVKTILEEAGTNISEVIKITIYLTDLNEFDTVNEVYKEYFVYDPPARSCIQVAALPKNAEIMIEAIAEA